LLQGYAEQIRLLGDAVVTSTTDSDPSMTALSLEWQAIIGRWERLMRKPMSATELKQFEKFD
jgi:hypothetical protein